MARFLMVDFIFYPSPNFANFCYNELKKIKPRIYFLLLNQVLCPQHGEVAKTQKRIGNETKMHTELLIIVILMSQECSCRYSDHCSEPVGCKYGDNNYIGADNTSQIIPVKNYSTQTRYRLCLL